MTWIVGDGFDYYASVADIARSVWDSAALTCTLTGGTNPRFLPGQCLLMNSGAGGIVQKTIPSNEATIYAAVAYYHSGVESGTTPDLYFTYRDGATAQCTVCLESGGNITLRRGDQTGTVVATYSGAFPQDTWNHFQIRVVIDGAAGTFTVRKNGSVSDSFAATGLNTRGGTANNYANVIYVASGTGFSTHRIDDLLFYSGSGGAPNTWVGDVRAICLMANGDTAQKNFAAAPAGAATVNTGPQNGRAGASTWAANTIYYSGPFTPIRGGTLTTLVLDSLSSGFTGHIKAALYASDGPGGTPGTLLATTNEIVNPGAGLVTFTFSGTTLLSTGRNYWVAYLIDAAPTSNSAGGAANLVWTQTQTYATGFPSTAPTVLTAATWAPYATFNIVGNSCCISELIANGDTDYIQSSNPGDNDLYNVADLPITPNAIVGVVSKVYLKKSDAGARQGQILMKSAATQVASPDSVISSTYTYVSRVDTVDPATSAAWTLAGVNAMQVGVKVTS